MNIIEVNKGHPNFRMIKNTSGVYSTILEGTVPPGVSWLVGDVGEITGEDMGDRTLGIPLFLRLLDATGTEMPDDTLVMLAYQRSNEETVTQIGNPISYRIFKRMTDNEQFNDNTRAARLLYTGENIVGLSTDTKLVMQIKSSNVIDPATSEVLFEIVELLEDEDLEEEDLEEDLEDLEEDLEDLEEDLEYY